ncbi:hypothetical protein JFK97_02140 [Chromobacterium phragmitis]|uniref:DNA methyltransferase n=1 Tax=Chromobacterium amazonense TaxID=1382803 RepID=UPI0021B8044A|nr:DNA methyltransferase [Chromobacterium amazonense]MBM2883179.1 hypothetical protein [Chromobacterium amazonense]MDE1716103.1 DNA methyltransferase [Chromobacterium amazonense]
MSIQLHNADCLRFLPTLPANHFDLILTDPPYSSGGLHTATRQQPPATKYLGNNVKRPVHQFAHDNKDQRSWCRWCVEWLTECHRVLKDGHCRMAVPWIWLTRLQLTGRLETCSDLP